MKDKCRCLNDFDLVIILVGEIFEYELKLGLMFIIDEPEPDDVDVDDSLIILLSSAFCRLILDRLIIPKLISLNFLNMLNFFSNKHSSDSVR